MADTIIDIPDDWTSADLNKFLTHLNYDKEKEERAVQVGRTTEHCWRKNACARWHQDGDEVYQGHCAVYSVLCATAIFNRQKPPRWLSKEEQ